MAHIRTSLPVLAAATLLAGAACAQQGTQGKHDMPGMPGMPGMTHGAGAGASSDLSEGEIRKVDKANKKLTIKHGPLKNLDMPGMTMVFAVKDDAMLQSLDIGTKVRFLAEKQNGQVVVTRIEPAR
jgi:Cu(I)/Ag(I) efflux system protein CusF